VIGIDIGKSSFHVVGHDARGALVLRQKEVGARNSEVSFASIGRHVGLARMSRKRPFSDPCWGLMGAAETVFNYGSPIVINYGVMYEYVDRGSGQWKAPDQQ
jgi:hypothetical protein